MVMGVFSNDNAKRQEDGLPACGGARMKIIEEKGRVGDLILILILILILSCCGEG